MLIFTPGENEIYSEQADNTNGWFRSVAPLWDTVTVLLLFSSNPFGLKSEVRIIDVNLM